MNVLAPNDAAELYRMLHHRRVLVAAFASVRISIDPSREPPNNRETRSLEAFVAYKATYGLVRADREIPALFARFDAWNRGVDCAGASDPRVLPLHVFDCGPREPELDTSLGAERFRKSFGGAGRRLDHSGRVWEKGPPHGREVLRVAGCPLPAGTHWDVSVKRKACSVANAREVWRIQTGGYVNVYPDAAIRGPTSLRRSSVRRVWPSKGQKMPLQFKGH